MAGPHGRLVVGIYEIAHHKEDYEEETLAKNVAMLLHLRGISVADIAANISRSPSTIYRMLKGEHTFSQAVLQDVAAFFYMTVPQLQTPLVMGGEFMNSYGKLEEWRTAVLNLLGFNDHMEAMHYVDIHKGIAARLRVHKRLWRKDVQARLRAMCDAGELCCTKAGWYALP
jgi:transcriptional regulator with XRE-family HTH domain